MGGNKQNCLFADDTILYIEKFKESTKILLELIRKLSYIVECQCIITYLYLLASDNWKIKSLKYLLQ